MSCSSGCWAATAARRAATRTNLRGGVSESVSMSTNKCAIKNATTPTCGARPRTDNRASSYSLGAAERRCLQNMAAVWCRLKPQMSSLSSDEGWRQTPERHQAIVPIVYFRWKLVLVFRAAASMWLKSWGKIGWRCDGWHSVNAGS